MKPTRDARAPALRIDVDQEWAWCGEQRLPLMPRAFAVLRYLVERAGQLVTKDELLTTVWRDAIVSDAALTSCIRDLRRALGDSSGAPRYIETVHRRGFRFIGPIAPSGAAPAAVQRPEPGRSAAVIPFAQTSRAPLVGRDREIARLHELLARTAAGQRQLVFVTGEPGIGKTALVEAFLSEIAVGGSLRVARGQCIEQYGAGEAYLPILEALGRLARETGGDRVAEVLKQHAPTWLLQLPAVLAGVDQDAVERRAQGATRERMLRELVEALEALARDEPLVLLLEDLHWSDSLTIDLLARLARRPEPAQLLVLGTYRPADLAGGQHPLGPVKHELELHGHCVEMALDFLTVAAVGEYLALRFPGHAFPPELAAVLHRSTDGNPLFAVSTIDYLIARGQLRDVDGQWALSRPANAAALGTPETLAQIVDHHVERLGVDEQALLAVASVAGAEFSAAVAAAGGVDLQDAERLCAGLARRRQFLRATGVAEWPDGTVSARYAFIHALYRDVLYARVSVGRRVGLHLRTGDLLERSHGARAPEIAGELAMHFEHGRDHERAVQYRRQAAEHALRKHGYREAVEHVTRALGLLESLPDSQARSQQELTLQVMLGSALTALRGHATPEVERAYGRARELCEHVDETPRLFPVLHGLGWFYLVRGATDAAREVGARLWAMAESTGDSAIRLAAHNALGLLSFYGGEFEAALDHLDRGSALYDPASHSPTRSPVFRANVDLGASCAGHGAWALWLLGYPDRALRRMREGVALARSSGHPFSLAQAHRFASAFHHCRREHGAVREEADASLAVATEHGFSAVISGAGFHRGWGLALEGQGEQGLAAMREWVVVCREIRAENLLLMYLGWLAEAHATLGRPAEGLTLVNEALAATRVAGHPYWWTAELHRLKGALALEAGSATDEDVESSFLEAVAIARRQRAKSFELRAATSLARLWSSRGRARDAHALLAEIHAWFTEGFDTPDLEEAQGLLEEQKRTG